MGVACISTIRLFAGFLLAFFSLQRTLLDSALLPTRMQCGILPSSCVVVDVVCDFAVRREIHLIWCHKSCLRIFSHCLGGVRGTGHSTSSTSTACASCVPRTHALVCLFICDIGLHDAHSDFEGPGIEAGHKRAGSPRAASLLWR